MSYIDLLANAEDCVTPGMSACQGCGGELILRTVLKVALLEYLRDAWQARE